MRNRPALSPAAWIITAAGSIGIIVGTFLPWLTSGSVQRHLYQVAGVADRLGFVGAAPAKALIALPVACALPIGLMAMSLPRVGAFSALALSAIALGAGGAALAMAGGRGAGALAVAPLGPATVAVGGIFVLVGALVTIGSTRLARRGSAREAAARANGFAVPLAMPSTEPNDKDSSS